MVITKKVQTSELRGKYDVLIGWGCSKNEFILKYNPWLFPLDYMIDMNPGYHGKTICGMTISNVDILEKFAEHSVCFIVFPNIEQAVDEEAKKYLKNYDTIVSGLVEYNLGGEDRKFYSESGEDLLFIQLIHKLALKDPIYLDIGVCHPVIRNNTYLLYENGYKNGILVEPNPDMCSLIKEYRPENVLLNMGACADESQSLRYYLSPQLSYRGHNTFDEKEAKKLGFTDYMDIGVANINEIIETYCKTTPDILDLDTEGMDFELIQALDTRKYRIKMISVETAVCGQKSINQLLEEKGYVHFASTRNNGIYLAKELMVN